MEPPMNFDPTKTTPLVCTCGNHTFTAAVFLRKVSELVSPNGKKGILPIPTFTCNACGKCPDEAVPEFIKLEAQGVTAPPTVTPPRLTLI